MIEDIPVPAAIVIPPKPLTVRIATATIKLINTHPLGGSFTIGVCEHSATQPVNSLYVNSQSVVCTNCGVVFPTAALAASTPITFIQYTGS